MLVAAAIEAHNSLQLWEEATDWQAQLDAVLGSDLGNIDMGNAAQEHIAGIQAEPGRAERVLGLGTQQEAELERAQKEILGLQAQHAISASHIKNAWKEIVELQAQLTSSSAQHGNVTADLEIARAEVAKLQAELMFLTEQHGGSAANLESVKQEINRLEAELLQYRSSIVDLQNTRNEIVGLQAQMKYAIGQHGASIAQLASA
jgi:chromosome segregation ATPase